MSATAAVDSEERLVRGTTGRLFLTISAGWGLLSLGQQALPPLLPAIIDDLVISSFQAGTALSVMWACFAGCQYLGGRIANDLSVKTALAAGVTVLAAGFGLLGTAVTYPLFVAATALLGIGGGLYLIAARIAIAQLFVERRGQAFGVNLAVGIGGNVLAAGAATFVVTVAVWRGLYAPLVVCLAGIGVLLHRWLPQSYGLAWVPLKLRSTLGRVFETREMRWLVLAYGLYAVVWQGLIGFLPTYLRAVRSLPPAVANAGFATVFLIGIVMSPLAGRASDAYPRPRVGSLALVITGGGILVLLLVPGLVGVVGAVALIGIGLHGFPPVMQAYLMDRFPDSSLGDDFGAFRTLYTGLGSVGPAYVGFVSGLTGYPVAFAGLAACLAVSLGLLYVTLVR